MVKINAERCDNFIAINLGCSNISGTVDATEPTPATLAINLKIFDASFDKLNQSNLTRTRYILVEAE